MQHPLFKKHKLIPWFIIVLCLAGAFYWFRYHHHEIKEPEMDVLVLQPKIKSTSQETILLPAYLYGYYESAIYSRVNGYVKQWFYDIGDEVKKDDVLAIIDAPELDKEYAQSKERYFALKAQYKLAKITADRWVDLLKSRAVSQQEADEKVNMARSALADMLAAKARQQRLGEMLQFESIRAPYDGRISARHIDVGDLVRADSPQQQASLFHMYMRHNNQLLLYVDVPQNYMDQIPLVDIQSLHFDGRVQKQYAAQFINSAHAYDPKKRSIKLKFIVTDETDELLPGAFVKIYLPLKETQNSVEVPLNTLLFRADGLEAAVVDQEQKIMLKKVTIGRNFGKTAEILSGLTANDLVVLNPYDSIQTGDKVHVLQKITT